MRRWRAAAGAALFCVLVFSLWPAQQPASAQSPSCQFTLGFATLRNMIPKIVGDCIENERHNPENGDGLQSTTRGLMVWRKADNFTAFTDGSHTWVNGPNGLQDRDNSTRFPWEAPPPTPTPVRAPTPTPVPAATPTPVVASPEQTIVNYFALLSTKNYSGAWGLYSTFYKTIRTLDNVRSQEGRFASYKIIGTRLSTTDGSTAYVAVGYDGILPAGGATSFAGAYRLLMQNGVWVIDGRNADERVMGGDTDPNNPYSAADLYFLALEGKSWDQAFAMESPSLQGSKKASDLSNQFGSAGQFTVRNMTQPDGSTITAVVEIMFGTRLTYDVSFNMATNNGLWQVNGWNNFNQRM